MLIYIVRHGETNLNKNGMIQGWIDEPLNESGRFLAGLTGKGMKDIHFDACISSPLVRASETAKIILKESGNVIDMTFDDRIKEISFGNLEGSLLSKEQMHQFFSNPFGQDAFPNGESVRKVCARTQDFLDELIARNDDKTYLVSTHGCALRAMLNKLYDNPKDFWQKHVPYNCVVNIVKAKDGKAEIIGNDVIYYDKKYCVDRYDIK